MVLLPPTHVCSQNKCRPKVQWQSINGFKYHLQLTISSTRSSVTTYICVPYWKVLPTWEPTLCLGFSSRTRWGCFGGWAMTGCLILCIIFPQGVVILRALRQTCWIQKKNQAGSLSNDLLVMLLLIYLFNYREDIMSTYKLTTQYSVTVLHSVQVSVGYLPQSGSSSELPVIHPHVSGVVHR